MSPSLEISSRPTQNTRGELGGKQIDDPRAAGRIARRRDDARRFVHGEVHELWARQRFAVDANFLPLRIDARAQLGDDLVIDLDAAFENELLALAPAGNAGRGEHLLQPVAAVLGLTIVRFISRRGFVHRALRRPVRGAIHAHVLRVVVRIATATDCGDCDPGVA